MDEGRRQTQPSTNGRSFEKTSAWSNDASAELLHSTPVQKKNVGAALDLSLNSLLTSFKMEECTKSTPIPADFPCSHRSLDTEKFPVSDPSASTIQRQRRELQLLMAELKDRDKELNTMVASHHTQLHAWEQDRQKVLRLEQRCACLDDELQKRNEVIRVLTKRLWVVETREKEVQKELRVAQQQLSEHEEKQQHISQKCQDIEEKNQSLNSTLMALSTQVGSLQVREEELSSMLKLKDKDVTEASGHIHDLTGRLRDLETTLKESRSLETKLLRDLEQSKCRHREAKQEITQLKGELQQQVAQSSTQREEMIRLKQELQLLHRDLALSVFCIALDVDLCSGWFLVRSSLRRICSREGASWKDELLELARSKQERTMSELCCLRQVCENQRNDLQLLQLNLESARESLKEKTRQGLLSRYNMSKTKNKSDNKTEKALAAEKEQFAKQQAVADSYRHCRNVKDMGVLWGNLHDRYGHIVALSAKYLCLKMEFHSKHKVIPGNLEASDETLEREAGTDMTKVFFLPEVLRQLDANGAKSTTPAGQCRLTPLIPLLLDCSFLYHFTVRLMFKLHSRFSPDVLLGHRERFRDLFMSLTHFFNRAREMEFFKSVIQIPELPDAPPNFLRAAALAEYIKPVMVMPNDERHEEDDLEPLPEFREQQQMPQYYLPNHIGAPDASAELRDTENESLRKELQVIKPELQLLKTEAQRYVTELKAHVNRLEAEVEEQRTQKQMAMVEKEQLRMEVEALHSASVANVGAQIGFKEADSRAQAAELRFSQLKERHAELITSYADLMKKNAETVKLLSTTKQEQDDLLRAKNQVESELENQRQEKTIMIKRHAVLSVSATHERTHTHTFVIIEPVSLDQMNQQQQDVERLNKELLEHRAELALLRSALDHKEQEGSQVSSSLAALQAERDVLLRSARDKDAELSSLRLQVQQQHSSLDLERDRINRELEALRAQLQQQLAINAEQKLEIDRLRRELDSTRAELARANGSLQSKEMSGSHLSSTLAGLQAEREVLLRSVREQEAEMNSLRQQAQFHLNSLEQERQRSSVELGSLHAQLQQKASREGELAQKLQEEQFCLLQCAVVEAEGIILDAVAKLDDPVYLRCTSSPEYLVNRAEITLGSIDKMQQSHLVYLGSRTDASGLLRAITQFSHLAADTIVNGAATSHSAPAEHADRLTDSCRDCANHCLQFLKDLKLQATLPRADSSAIRHTVQRILSLGQAVHMLVTAATDLQKDIVEGGRGAASVTDFYAKNSRWTEGLISASKAVGWGATQLLDSADRVVGENGTYEELIACSHEIAGSTAQLVAASKVKADRANKKLVTLQQASRHVNDMAAVVVTSSKHGQQQISDHVVMDFSGMSLIKLKKEELEAQVKVLQLESHLEQERVRLGELRKKHYELGISDTTEALDASDSFPPPPSPTLLDAAVAQSFSHSQPYVNTPSFAQTNPFGPTQTQTFSLPESYTPSTYTPSQPYTPTQPFTPSQPYTPNQSYLKPQSYSLTQPLSHSSSLSQPQPPSQPQKTTSQSNTESTKPASKKSNIFLKSGNLLKNAVSADTVTCHLLRPNVHHTRADVCTCFFSCYSSNEVKLEQANPEARVEKQYKWFVFSISQMCK
ncbi:Huntingtin-interacting protein 1-related protein [Channa argus]|uniref:Huntingtin-interacting protein 1-related protein n=1 Tax=Channa argus TaxID=215402 RepID=A0A6G1QGX6_CHAAH|nr:Huntingtin-interacting protein 1-related protein [Channa argus]